MELERDTIKQFIEYLIEHGYPESSIAIEYKVGERYRLDIAILDLDKNIPIQIFEVKSRKTPDMVRMGTEQLKKYLSVLKNKDIPAYLIFPSNNHPFFEIQRIYINAEDIVENDSKKQLLTLNYLAQRNSRIAEEANIIKKEKENVVDCFKITCWIAAGLMLIIGVLNKLKIIELSVTDMTILGVVIALVLIPFASKLKILGVEFERLTEKDKGENA